MLKKFRMRTLLIVFLIVIFAYPGYSQIRIGKSASDIKAEFANGIYSLEEKTNKQNIYSVQIEISNMLVLYFFDSNFICYLNVFIPNDKRTLNNLITLYNKQYIILSHKKWRYYTHDGTFDCELQFNEYGPLFEWKASEEQ